MAQPNIQVPSGPIGDTYEWRAYLAYLGQLALAGRLSGSSSSRPTQTMAGRWIGMPYFDESLGFEIHLKSVNPDVWVRYDGTAV